MSKTLFLLRAISGAGKSTLAFQLLQLPNSLAFSADDYFIDEDGNYVWDHTRISEAHKWCRKHTVDAMFAEVDNIILHNTNTSEKEIKPYLDSAEEYGYKVVSLIVENRHRGSNTHNVPDETLDRQELKLRNSIVLR